LNPALIPILQNISPGEIQHCENAQDFSRKLVTKWLSEYKFKYWTTHSSTGEPVTEKEKKKRAQEIARRLCKHSDWLTHGRSIKISDFAEMRLTITDYSVNPELDEAIMRYYTLLRMTFETTNIYKLFETPNSQIYRFTVVGGQHSQQNIPSPNNKNDIAIIDFECPSCHAHTKIQANLDKESPIQPGVEPYPTTDNTFVCPKCKVSNNILPIKLQIEAQSGKKVV